MRTDLEYIKMRQKQWEKKRQRAAELEAKKEAARIAQIEAEVRKQEEIAARKKLLMEQQEDERIRQKHAQRKKILEEQRWDKQVDILLTQIKDRFENDNKLEEIRIIIQNREPSLQVLDWDSWLSDPLNRRLADLDFERAMGVFKRDNLMAYRRKRTKGKPRKIAPNYALSFTGNDADGSRADLVTTQFMPNDPDGSGKHLAESGFTMTYWLRPDEAATDSFHISWKPHNNARFDFGLKNKGAPYIGTGPLGRVITRTWADMFDDSGNSDLKATLLDDDEKILLNGTWYHIVVTYAGTDNPDSDGNMLRKIYINGRHIYGGFGHSRQSVNWTRTGDTMTHGLAFGMRAVVASGTDSETGRSNTKYNNGNACALDEVAIYKEEKDADWVTGVYNGGIKFNHKGGGGLVGYWRFNEGSGTTVEDLGPYGYHGTLTNASHGTSIDTAINNLPPSGTPTWIKHK